MDAVQGIGLSIEQYQSIAAYYENHELTQSTMSLLINRDGIKTSLSTHYQSISPDYLINKGAYLGIKVY
jgi:hypothetical protein